MTVPAPATAPRVLPRALLAPVVVLGLAGVWAMGGNPLPVVAVFAVLAAAHLLLTAPLARTLRLAFFLVLLCDAPQDRPADGLWRSPLYWLGAFWVNNLGKTLGVDALSFSVLDVVVAVLCGAGALRVLFGTAAPAHALPRGVRQAAWVMLLALGAWTAWGVWRGGSPTLAFWQLRQLSYIPVLILLLDAAGPGDGRDARWLGTAVVGAACVKVAVGAFFYFAIARPNGWAPKYVTSHADTLIFATAALVVWARWLHLPSRRSTTLLLTVLPWLGFGIFLNDRRIAYVAVAVGFAVVFLLTPPSSTRRIALGWALALLPVGALYTAAGWGSDAAYFRPVASLRSMATPDEDSSTESRVIENRNLLRNYAQVPLLGAGFGHEYVEYELGPDLGGVFALYRAIPHNSVLALLWELGPLGLALVLAPFVITFLAGARRARGASSPLGRATGAACAAVVPLYVIQAWGDMGTQNWAASFLFAGAAALASSSSTEPSGGVPS